jgi:hypothetical protein
MTNNPTLQSAIAERNAAIRAALESQMTVSRLQEQVIKLKSTASSKPLDREPVDLFAEISRLREILGDAPTSGREYVHHSRRRQLDAAEAAYKRLLQEVDSLHKELKMHVHDTRENDAT